MEKLLQIFELDALSADRCLHEPIVIFFELLTKIFVVFLLTEVFGKKDEGTTTAT
jgi:hypothetical protein